MIDVTVGQEHLGDLDALIGDRLLQHVEIAAKEPFSKGESFRVILDGRFAHGGRDEWVATIQKMMAAGAEGPEDQFMAVLQYLTKNFGPVAAKISINQAPAAELESGLGLTAKEAAAIVTYRNDKGPFKAVDDLKKVPDLDFKKIEAQKDRIAF